MCVCMWKREFVCVCASKTECNCIRWNNRLNYNAIVIFLYKAIYARIRANRQHSALGSDVRPAKWNITITNIH